MTQNIQPVLDAVEAKFPGQGIAIAPLNPSATSRVRQMCLRVPADKLREVFAFLQSDDRCRFDQVSDITCVDYLNFPDAEDRYGVTYTIVSTTHTLRLWIKCMANDPNPVVPSAVPFWKGADWLEREVFDLFGVTFEGHPDLRRIMTWDGFDAHPLRKDYPLRGRGERENYPVITTESA